MDESAYSPVGSFGLYTISFGWALRQMHRASLIQSGDKSLQVSLNGLRAPCRVPHSENAFEFASKRQESLRQCVARTTIQPEWTCFRIFIRIRVRLRTARKTGALLQFYAGLVEILSADHEPPLREPRPSQALTVRYDPAVLR